MEKMIKTVQRVLKEREMLLIDNPQEVYDMLNLKISMNMGEHDASMLIGKKRCFVVCDALLYPMLMKENPAGAVLVKADSMEYLRNNRLFVKEWREIVRTEKTTKLGLANMGLELFFKNVSTFRFLSPARTLGRMKGPAEISGIKRLAKVLKGVFEFAGDSLRESMTDVELRNIIDEKIYSLSCDRRYLPTYVGFDSKSIYPTLCGERLKKGSIVLLDAGVMKNGRGLSFSTSVKFGQLNREKERIFRTARDGMDVILSAVRAGSSPAAADAEYREYLSRHRMLENSLEYSVSFVASAYAGEINSVTDSEKFITGNVIKVTSSVFLPAVSGARFEAIILIKEKGHEKII